MPREDFGKRIPVDPRFVESIQRSPTMMAEQGPAFMQEWGGPELYQEMSKGPMEARVTYYAVLEGNIDPDQISLVTGLDAKEVSKGLRWLERKGYVEVKTDSPKDK